MKYVCSALLMICTFGLFGEVAINLPMFAERYLESRVKELDKKYFFYELIDDSKNKEILSNINKESKLKSYGPYRLVIKGIPPKTKFDLYSYKVNFDKPEFMASGYVDDNGEAWFKLDGKNTSLSDWKTYCGGLLPGEPMTTLLILKNHEVFLEKPTTYLIATVVPEPFVVYGENGEKLTLELYWAKKPFYFLRGNKFEPNQEITVSIEGKEGTFTKMKVANFTGKFVSLLEGQNKVKLSEQEVIKVTPKNGKPIVLDYRWEVPKNQNYLTR